MRPQILFPLFAEILTLPGVGAKIAALLTRLAGPHIVDLLWHLPSGVINRNPVPAIAGLESGRTATLEVAVEAHQPSGGRGPYRVITTDDTGTLDLVFFHAKGDYLLRELPVGAKRFVSGRIEWYRGVAQMAHPDYIVAPDARDQIPSIEPVYPLTTGLTPKPLNKAIAAALTKAPKLQEWQDQAWLDRNGWPDWQTALLTAHAPQSDADLLPTAPARARLAYDELLANQLALALIRRAQRRQKGRSTAGNGDLRAKVVDALGFALTTSQTQAVAEIDADMAAQDRMLRLLQGDVGSGKTVVALLAMLNAVEAGRQAALLAPTEILARQHYRTLQPLAEAAGVKIAILTGRDRGKAREPILEGLRDGALPLIVGTHALVQESVEFHDLALAVVDEQHRFGVHQRLQLASKGAGVDLLVMTATPIPRTLALTAYGDMEVSRLTEKPPGRQPVDTRVLPADRLPELITGLGRKLAEGAQAYWVCPLVEESEKSDMAAATERYEDLRRHFGDRVGLVHGRLKGPEKDAIMARFTEGSIDILVATTVIEVGVDVPAATIMVVEHAERFGLAQLHQLRGRVGRGDAQSTCFLVYAPPLSETARQRLATLRETEDGFVIAEADLKLRGAGEVLGTRQSGLQLWRLADLAAHGNLLASARDDVRLILNRDPEMEMERGRALRLLLYLFEQDAAVRYLRSG
ncbi:MAG: ATP-dependent DNA helicase RecG [Pseudomonadota bacterium]